MNKLTDYTPEQIAAARAKHTPEMKATRRYETTYSGRWYYVQYSENPSRADQVYLTDLEMLILGYQPEPEPPERIRFTSQMDPSGRVISKQIK